MTARLSQILYPNLGSKFQQIKFLSSGVKHVLACLQLFKICYYNRNNSLRCPTKCDFASGYGSKTRVAHKPHKAIAEAVV